MIIAFIMLLITVALLVRKTVLIKKFQREKAIILKYNIEKYIHISSVFFISLFWIPFTISNFIHGVSVIVALNALAIFFAISNDYFLSMGKFYFAIIAH